MSELDREESARVARRIHAEVKSCYFNARRAINRLSDYATATYVEGFVVTPFFMAIEHGWIERDGRIIDPTLVLTVQFTTGYDLDVVQYFPGLRIQGGEGLRAFYREHGPEYQRSPLFYAFGWGGASHPGFHRARQAAEEARFPPDLRERIEAAKRGIRERRPKGTE